MLLRLTMAFALPNSRYIPGPPVLWSYIPDSLSTNRCLLFRQTRNTTRARTRQTWRCARGYALLVWRTLTLLITMTQTILLHYPFIARQPEQTIRHFCYAAVQFQLPFWFRYRYG